jgi:hypothetical protein
MIRSTWISRFIAPMALALIASFTVAHVSVASTVTVSVRGSVNAVYISTMSGSTAASGVSATLYNAKSAVVATGTTDDHGALVFHDIAAGAGYRATVGGQSVPAFSVLDTKAPNASLYSGTALHAGLNYITMRDGIQLAATVRLPDGKTLANGPFVTLIEYSGYATAAPHSLIDSSLGRPGHPSNDPLLPSSATALGALLSPLAAILPFVSPGLEKDANCAGLFGQARQGYAPVPAPRTSPPAKPARKR